MTSLPARAQALLDTAVMHRSTCGAGYLQWQQWSDRDAGPLLLLLHGGFGSWTHWLANIEELRQHREVWTVDLPGLGSSGDIFRSATAAHFAAMLTPGLKHLLGARSYQLAAFSFGAMVGAELAAQTSCERFYAIGAAGCGNLHVQVPLAPPPPADTPWSAAVDVHRQNLSALMFSADFEIDELAVQLHADNLARARFNSRGLSRTNAFLDRLPGIGAELVGIWGCVDATAGDAAAIDARRLVFENHGGSFETLEGVGHWAMYEAPERVNSILLTR